MAAMRDAAATLEADPEFKPHILAPLEIHGIDAFQDAQLVVKARIKTVPLKQWLVGRELRRRLAKVFAERGIAPPTGRLIVSSGKSELPSPRSQIPRRDDVSPVIWDLELGIWDLAIQLNAVTVTGRVMRGGDARRRVERIDGFVARRPGPHRADDRDDVAVGNDLALVGNRHQRPVDLEELVRPRPSGRGRCSGAERRGGPSACRAPADSTARPRPRRA